VTDRRSTREQVALVRDAPRAKSRLLRQPAPMACGLRIVTRRDRASPDSSAGRRRTGVPRIPCARLSANRRLLGITWIDPEARSSSGSSAVRRFSGDALGSWCRSPAQHRYATTEHEHEHEHEHGPHNRSSSVLSLTTLGVSLTTLGDDAGATDAGGPRGLVCEPCSCSCSCSVSASVSIERTWTLWRVVVSLIRRPGPP
jgi:hypothetical protein